MRFTLVTIVLTSVFALLLPVVAAKAASSQLEIISISEVADTSVEILFKSSVPKKSLANYVITAAVDPSVGQAKNIKIIKTKATGLITTVIKNLNPKVAYKFSVSAKTNKGKMISSEAVEYYSLSNLMDVLSNLPVGWGNPTPIPTPTPTQTATPIAAPIAAPAFTLSSSSETRTVNTAATGFTITSTGGAIASFAISATPAGMSFSTSTGALSGTPTSVAGATAYTITATNTSASATQTFTLTVTAPTVISVAAIAGVTAPVRGETPVIITTAGTGYTGTVSWSGSPATFAPGTTYTATINLIPTSGYTLTGVTANLFTVAGATSDTNPANSGVITAVFDATGYSVGDTGPGGGIVYYVSDETFISAGSDCYLTCKYLEVAPSNWNGEGDINKPWVSAGYTPDDTPVANDENPSPYGVGLGYGNSSAIVSRMGTYSEMDNNYAAGAARAYEANSKTDWYLPTTAELNLLCQWNRGVAPDVATVCSAGSLNSAIYGASLAGFLAQFYWSSSELDAVDAWGQVFGFASQAASSKTNSRQVRPVRAF